MRPSSSPSDPPGLFDELLARGGARAAVSDAAWLRAMLRAEAALAEASAEAGAIPQPAAAAIVEACAALRPDMAALAEAAARFGNPVPPLVAALREAVPEEHREYVHRGATSQDILDTGAMLIARRALEPVLSDLAGAADAAAGLAEEHRDTPMLGRTLLQQAVPITFGLKAAGWLAGLDAALERLAWVREHRLAAQLGGAAGTLAGLGPHGPAVLAGYSSRLCLVAPDLPWHTERSRPAELAAALGAAAGAVGKVARDVALLAQNEVGEVSEAEPGGSSVMAHKRNPVAAVSAVACAAQAPGLVATIFAAMVQEHERAAGGWHAEWRPQRELLVSVGSAAAWLRACLWGLRVHAGAMRANLDGAGPTLTEPGATRGDPFGSAGHFIDAALARHKGGLE